MVSRKAEPVHWKSESFFQYVFESSSGGGSLLEPRNYKDAHKSH